MAPRLKVHSSLPAR